jgi:hypothetical protein
VQGDEKTSRRSKAAGDAAVDRGDDGEAEEPSVVSREDLPFFYFFDCAEEGNSLILLVKCTRGTRVSIVIVIKNNYYLYNKSALKACNK